MFKMKLNTFWYFPTFNNTGGGISTWPIGILYAVSNHSFVSIHVHFCSFLTTQAMHQIWLCIMFHSRLSELRTLGMKALLRRGLKMDLSKG